MNKREFKKYVETLGSSICVEIFSIGAVTLKADRAKIEEAMNMVWNAMVSAKHGANDHFDRKERDFDNRHEYNRAKKVFSADLFTRLESEFETVIGEALKLVNSAIPAKE